MPAVTGRAAARFDLPIALMQDAEALERIAYELVESKAADNVRYVEIRWGPLLHVAGGLSLADGIAAVCRGAHERSRPAGVAVRLISTAIRSHDPEGNVELAETAARFIDQGLTGWDLAGPEAGFPDPLVHARPYEAARANGLRITIHAGEWGGAGQVRRTLESTRSGSPMAPTRSRTRRCARAAARAASPSTCARPRTGRPASSRRSAEHPLARLHRLGVPVTLSTDDMTVSDMTLSEEYIAAVEKIGLTLPELWAIDRRALDVAFADEATLAPLRVEFDAWAAGIPEPEPSGRYRPPRPRRRPLRSRSESLPSLGCAGHER